MRMQSVRDLKSEIQSRFLESPALPDEFASAFRVKRASAMALHADALHTRAQRRLSVAMGVSLGRRKGDYCVSVRIQAKKSAATTRLAKRIHAHAKGECDIRFVKDVRKQKSPAWFQKRRRPLEAGVSTGLAEVGGAGTLGCIVEDDDGFYALSNNHVLADVNKAQPGDPVVQPGPLDQDPRPNTLIGVLDRFVPMSFRRSNVVDCAVASLLPDVEFFSGWTEAIPGVIRGVRQLDAGDLGRTVRKAGRTTGVTEGVITSVDVDRLDVNMADPGRRAKIAVFSDQIEIGTEDGSAFSAAGDSGSLIVDTTGRAVALLFSGGLDEDGKKLTWANRIDRVLSKLGVSITR